MSSLERLAPPPPSAASGPPLRGRRYGEDRLHLLVRDPARALAVWEICPELAARAAERAAASGAPLRYRLRVEWSERETDPASAATEVDLPDALRDEAWYLDLPRSGGGARAVLGLDLPGGFLTLLTSRWVPVPPNGPCAERGEWEMDAAARAWIEQHEALARAASAGAVLSSGARYLLPPAPPRP
ncbi:MAG TPA: DUF4912 domain-containing protein [Candidatus Eisenbacteria bacterium]|nr:DUF4912 domain-containing protein [Candidatus Eisenbacteria bacterium]